MSNTTDTTGEIVALRSAGRARSSPGGPPSSRDVSARVEWARTARAFGAYAEAYDIEPVIDDPELLHRLI